MSTRSLVCGAASSRDLCRDLFSSRQDRKGRSSRQQTLHWGLQAASVNLTTFAHKIIVVNVSTDHGYTGAGVLFGYEDSRALEPTFMFHEMGHDMGLDHSFGEGPVPCAAGDPRPGAFCDSWDVMSAMNVFSYQDAQNRRSGPGLNAPNLQRLGVVDRARIWSPPTGWFSYDVTLAAINRPDVDGYLMATFPGPSQNLTQGDLSIYYLEFRQRTKWDQGLPTDAVLIHEVRGSDSLSRLLTGGQLAVGQPFSPPGGGVIVQVNSIDSTVSQAKLSVSGVVPSKIMARSSRKVLDVTGGPTATGNGVPIQQWDYWGGGLINSGNWYQSTRLDVRTGLPFPATHPDFRRARLRMCFAMMK